jgi:hypothetical protein
MTSRFDIHSTKYVLSRSIKLLLVISCLERRMLGRHSRSHINQCNEFGKCLHLLTHVLMYIGTSVNNIKVVQYIGNIKKTLAEIFV